jgi:hypothetical protein
MERMDICAPRPGKDGKTFWLKIGTFWPAKDGKPGGQIVLDAYPVPDEKGRVVANLFEPKAREDAAPKGYTPRQKPARDDDPDESIPF